MWIRLVLAVGIGVAVGALLGQTRSCETGGCPLTSTPLRGAIWGGFLGLLFGISLTPGA